MELIEKDIARFWSHVDRSGECWIWKCGLDKDGYGKFSYFVKGKKKQVRAHRVAFFLAHGEIDDTLMVLHKCSNPPCVRHLYQGTGKNNADDRNEIGHTARGKRAGNHIHVERRPRGERHGRSKLTWEKVRQIRSRTNEGLKTLASEFGVSEGAIWFILNGLHWKDAAQ
jgi:hypothetical protein